MSAIDSALVFPHHAGPSPRHESDVIGMERGIHVEKYGGCAAQQSCKLDEELNEYIGKSRGGSEYFQAETAGYQRTNSHGRRGAHRTATYRHYEHQVDSGVQDDMI